jgi:hypothetical protein
LVGVVLRLTLLSLARRVLGYDRSDAVHGDVVRV